MALISKLAQFVKQFTGGKAQSLPNQMRRYGVKPEELKWSGVLDELPSSGYVSTDDLQNILSRRKDKFDLIQTTSFPDVTLPDNNLDQYIENVYTFTDDPFDFDEVVKEYEKQLRAFSNAYDDPGNELDHLAGLFPENEIPDIINEMHRNSLLGVEDLFLNPPLPNVGRFESGHYPGIPNYLMHTRSDMPSMNRYRLQEIQSDLVNKQREYNYIPRENPYTKDHPKSPFEKDWLRRGLEREIDHAYDAKAQQFEIPISGKPIDYTLARGTGVQDWYENTVEPTLAKIGKQHGLDYWVEDTPIFQPSDVDWYRNKVVNEGIDSIEDGYLRDLYHQMEAARVPRFKDMWALEAAKRNGRSVRSAVLDLPPNKRPQFELYAGAGMAPPLVAGLLSGQAEPVQAQDTIRAERFPRMANAGRALRRLDLPILGDDLFPGVSSYLENLGMPEMSEDASYDAMADVSLPFFMEKLFRGDPEQEEAMRLQELANESYR